ncbi:MAG TPA: MFS transporter, partial [Vicinamibacterales bacterium]|nr:MFS transporter [Vicinamibacterales bacterium]
DTRDRLSILVLFDAAVVKTTIHTAALMGAFLFMYHSTTFWYPTLLGQMHRQTLPYMVAFNVAAVAGAVFVGRWSEGALGRRGAATLATLVGVLSLPLYVWGSSGVLLIAGALVMGFFGVGNFGVVPAYLNERFPTFVRAVGAGFAYHVGAGFGSSTPFIVGFLQDRGYSLAFAMTLCIAASGAAVTALIWMGPETRGREFKAET